MLRDINTQIVVRLDKRLNGSDVLRQVDKFETSSLNLASLLQALIYGLEKAFKLLLTLSLNLWPFGLQSGKQIFNVSMKLLFLVNKLAKAGDHSLYFPPIFEAKQHHFCDLLGFYLQHLQILPNVYQLFLCLLDIYGS